MRRSGLFVLMSMFALALFVGVGVSRAEWEVQETGKTSLWGISFVDENHGWICGHNSTLLKTTNGGDTWESVNFSEEGYDFDDIAFVDENIGVCYGYTQLEGAGLYYFILKTTDGGETWKNISPPDGHGYHGMCVLDEDTYWLGSGLIVYHTKDGGETWETQETIHHTSTERINYRSFIDFDFFDTMTGWGLTREYGDIHGPTWIYRTKNGGKDWYEITRIIDDNQRHIYAMSEESLWTCYFPVCFSHDGGETWEKCEDLPSCRDIYPIDNDRVFVLDDYGLLYTSDCGRTYETLFTYGLEQHNYFFSITGVNENNVWCLCPRGEVVKYTRDDTSVKKNEAPQELPALTNTPNPFNPATTISFTLPTDSHTTLTVHDITGRKVATLADNFMSAGKHSAVFDGSNLASGVYFYRIEAGKMARTGKMLLIK